MTNWLQTLRSWRRWTHGNLLKKTQCKESNISQRKWKFYFSSRRWTNQSFRKRSGTENTQGNTQFEEKVTLIFLENQKGLFHHLKTLFRMPVKQLMIVGPCQETSYSAMLNQPNIKSPKELLPKKKRKR